jgi:hypothetical protein
MRKQLVLAVLVILLIGLILLGFNDGAISVGDTRTFASKVTDGVSKASNSSASAAITITMTGMADQ